MKSQAGIVDCRWHYFTHKKTTNAKAGQSLDGVWDVSSGMTLANTAKAKLVAKDSV